MDVTTLAFMVTFASLGARHSARAKRGPSAAAVRRSGGVRTTPDNTKRSQRLRCYRWRHEYSKTRGSRVSGRRSIAARREWNDRHFMNREPSLIDLSARGPRARFRPPEVTFPPNMAACRTCAAYLRARLAGRAPVGPHAPPPLAKVRAIANSRINYSRRYLKIFVRSVERQRAATEPHTRTASPPRGD